MAICAGEFWPIVAFQETPCKGWELKYVISLPNPIPGQLRGPQLYLRGGHAVLLCEGARRVLQGVVGVQEGLEGLRRFRDAPHSRKAGAAGL